MPSISLYFELKEISVNKIMTGLYDLHQQPNVKTDGQEYIVSPCTGDRFEMSRSPVLHVAKRVLVKLGYELPNDYAMHDDGNLSNPRPSAEAADLSGHGPVLPGTVHQKYETPWPSIGCVARLTVSPEIFISRGS
jgi:hypothetical protein